MEPCPLGVLLFRKRRGACQALLWDDLSAIYRCGAMVKPHLLAKRALSPRMQFFVPILGFLLRHGARRWIASGIGCDSTLEPVPSKEALTEPNYNKSGSHD
jgi:hypothetical protein